MILTVSPSGAAQFRTIQEAVDFAPQSPACPTVIRVYQGAYHEKLHIVKSNLRIIGDDAACVTLTNSDYALQKYPDGTDKGTFLSYTAIITGDNVEIENMTIRNDAGPGDAVGQAVSVYAAGDRFVMRHCVLFAHQDTLFCGPTMKRVADNALPYVLPIQSESVGDAGISANRQYFENCLIQGDVDFIFGPYTCWFEKCRLVCNNRSAALNGYYTAANTPNGQPYGFVFNDCHLTSDGCADETVSLGRPWRAYARTVFKNCQMDACVKHEGWDDWGTEKPVTYRYQEYGTKGADMGRRHPNATLLSQAEAAAITVKTVLSGWDGWAPQTPFKTVYIAGDSTAADYPEAAYPMTGWGQALPALMPPTVFVQNEAQCGRSGKSFVEEQRLFNIAHCLRKGDILLIQFGHNDEKPDPARATSPFTTYTDYLTLYLDAARERGAIPVLITPIVRRAFAGGALNDTHGDYPPAMRTLAKQKGALIIDAEALTRQMVETLAEEGSLPLWCHVQKGHRNYKDGLADNTHLSFAGAYEVAKLVMQKLVSFNLVDFKF